LEIIDNDIARNTEERENLAREIERIETEIMQAMKDYISKKRSKNT